ncbi:MAG: hypothetical protein QGH20_01780, partial [Candidatus Latescibacteria bacterium]|nr:hypothetical protein [Candidatus Latescibacterota bacterium]
MQPKPATVDAKILLRSSFCFALGGRFETAKGLTLFVESRFLNGSGYEPNARFEGECPNGDAHTV